jgi:hypothetical protein
MRIRVLEFAVAFSVASVGAAAADVVAVNCDGYVVSMAEEIATAGEERAGTMEEFEENVCTVSQQLPIDDYTRPTSVDILIEPYDISTTVVIFPTTQRDSAN